MLIQLPLCRQRDLHTGPLVPENKRGVRGQGSSVKIRLKAHIKSTLVSTPMVLVPSGSTSRASLRPSERARSGEWESPVRQFFGLPVRVTHLPIFAAVTARIIHPGRDTYFMIMFRIWPSMSRGWSPTGNLVNPGKSTNVSVRTFGEYIRRLMGLGEMPSIEFSFSYLPEAPLSWQSANLHSFRSSAPYRV